MTPCCPTRPARGCTLCARHRPDLEEPARRRLMVVIDASTLGDASRCELFEPGTAPRPARWHLPVRPIARFGAPYTKAAP